MKKKNVESMLNKLQTILNKLHYLGKNYENYDHDKI